MAEKRDILRIDGMHCASCASSIEKHLSKIDGIKKVVVSFAQEQAEVIYDSTKVEQSTIFDAVKQIGYRVQLWKEREEELEKLEAAKEVVLLRIKLIVSIILSSLLLIGAMVPGAPDILKNPWIMMLFATPVQFWVGSRFYISTFKGLRHGITTMDTLIALGTSVAYFYSVFVVIFENQLESLGLPTHLYFEASAAIITFILLGNFLETRARRQASQAIRKLMGLQPKTALVFREQQNEWVETSVEEIVVGDTIRIKPGGVVPVDGVIKSGSSSLNESMITGESKPVRKQEGDEVIGGTISMSGSFEMRATKVGKDTTLAKIITMVAQAQKSKAPVQKLVDKISSVFVPTVIVLSIITFVIWFFIGPQPQFLHALIAMVSVLIIACPCALGLATPTSIMVGIGRGAQEGILIKGAESLEIAGKVNVVIFDKTGTLTRGVQEVHGFEFEKDIDEIFKHLRLDIPETISVETYINTLVYAIEELSNHPISQAVMRYMEHNGKINIEIKDKLKVEDFENIEGLGLRAVINGHTILLGSRRLMEQKDVPVAPDADSCAIAWSKEAKSVSFITIDDKVIAYFCVADTIREGVKQTIKKLKENNIQTVLITGDNQLAADAVAQMIGIEKVLAEVLPADKAKEVERLSKEGNSVAMVGDGINDAPALAAADVGIAMGSGTDVALETAHVALLRNDIALVPKVITLSQAVIANIRQNLIWAFGYNIILLPVAMGILYPLFGIMLNPIFASIAMAFSSISVVLNALRLRWITL